MIRFWPLGVNFGSVLFDFGIREWTLGPLSQFWAPGAEFVPVGAGFGVFKNIIGTTVISTKMMQNYEIISTKN